MIAPIKQTVTACINTATQGMNSLIQGVKHTPAGISSAASKLAAVNPCKNMMTSDYFSKNSLKNAFWSVVGFPKIIWGSIKNFFSYLTNFFQEITKDKAANQAQSQMPQGSSYEPASNSESSTDPFVQFLEKEKEKQAIKAKERQVVSEEIKAQLHEDKHKTTLAKCNHLTPSQKANIIEWIAYNHYCMVMASTEDKYKGMSAEERKESALNYAIHSIGNYIEGKPAILKEITKKLAEDKHKITLAKYNHLKKSEQVNAIESVAYRQYWVVMTSLKDEYKGMSSKERKESALIDAIHSIENYADQFIWGP
jgi:hypothetical protein